jgi:hypothetical protein
MATNWTVLSGADIRKVISAGTQQRANENTADTVLEEDDYDPLSANRRDQLVAGAVAEVRGAIRTAGRYPVSVTAGAVPPEGEYKTLVLAAWRLIASQPGTPESGLQWAVLTDPKSPFAELYREACAWVEGLAKGRSFTQPTDPTGVDYLTEVDAADNPAVTGICWGDSLADSDEYDAGVTASGWVINKNSQNMNTW